MLTEKLSRHLDLLSCESHAVAQRSAVHGIRRSYNDLSLSRSRASDEVREALATKRPDDLFPQRRTQSARILDFTANRPNHLVGELGQDTALGEFSCPGLELVDNSRFRTSPLFTIARTPEGRKGSPRIVTVIGSEAPVHRIVQGCEVRLPGVAGSQEDCEWPEFHISGFDGSDVRDLNPVITVIGTACVATAHFPPQPHYVSGHRGVGAYQLADWACPREGLTGG